VNGRVPRYLQIADALRERLRRGELVPGTRLETQRALARRFDVTLMTLRQALETLELDTEIPPELYKAVAEALAWAYRLTGRAAATG